MERLALLPPDAARAVGERLAQFGQEREALRAKLMKADQMTRVADALLVAFGANGRGLLLPTTDPAQRGRIVGKAVERVLADLEASSPEAVRDRVTAMIRQVTVQANGRVVVKAVGNLWSSKNSAEMEMHRQQTPVCTQRWCRGDGP